MFSNRVYGPNSLPDPVQSLGALAFEQRKGEAAFRRPVEKEEEPAYRRHDFHLASA